MFLPARSDSSIVHTPLTDAIVRHRKLLFGAVGVLYVLSFNGQWRIGRDSAIYRGLAANLAAGEGYTFSEFGQSQVYPGLPLLLAGVKTVFGDGALAPVLMILGMAAMILVLSYRLIAMHYPQWVAVCVACGVGINARFLQLSHELMTDIPFLLGVVLSLYGLERLRLGYQRNALILSDLAVHARIDTDRFGFETPQTGWELWRGRLWAGAILLAGLALAASMRPTFWVLALAWAAACVWGLIRWQGARLLYAACLASLLVVWLGAVSLDPRTDSFDPVGGGYEREAIALLPRAADRIDQNLPLMFGRHVASAFFGQTFFPAMSTVLTIVIIGSSILVMRRQPLWGLLMLLTFPPTLLLSTVPRYYIMSLPLLILGGLLVLNLIARRVPPVWAERVLLCGLIFFAVPNLSRCVKVIYEQRSMPFFEKYERGRWVPVAQMSDMIQTHLPAGESVIGPEGSVMAYMSGRRVYLERELLRPNANRSPAESIADSGVQYALFPVTIYERREPRFARLIQNGTIVPVEVIAEADDFYLARFEVEP